MLVNGEWQSDARTMRTDAHGKFVRPVSTFRNWVTPDGSPGPTGNGGFRAEPGDIYYLLSRRLLNGHPAYFDESFIPYSITPDIDTLDINSTSLYSFLQDKALKKVFKVIQTVEVSQASGDSARYLDLDEGIPVLVVHRLLLSSDNAPVAYTKLQGRSDSYKFQTEFERLR